MKKALITLVLLTTPLVSANIVINGTVKLGNDTASRQITLQTDQTRFHYWTTNGVLLIGQIIGRSSDDIKLQLTFGQKAGDSDPQDQAVRFNKIITKRTVTLRWGEETTLEATANSTPLSLTVSLTQSD